MLRLHVLTTTHQLQQGSGSVKSFDTHGIKTNVSIWWNQLNPNEPAIPSRKEARGFGHPVTGRLLCPVELDWDDVKYVSH